MPDSDRDPASEIGIRYDDWPVEGVDEYADWAIERSIPRQQDGTTEKLAEEYRTELAEEVEWIGFPGGHGAGSPLLYSQQESALYEGELDEGEKRVVLREASRHDVDEESLGDHIERIGEEHDWEWLSSFARTYLEDDEYERPSFSRRDSEFHERSVVESDLYDLAFFASHTFDDASGRTHIIERFFDVYLDDDTAEVTTVEVSEKYLIAEEPVEDRRSGDAELIDENERKIDVNVDTERFGGDGELAALLEEWHTDHVGWQREEELG